MSTWTSVTIETPGALTLETLPDDLTADGEMWDGYEVDDERVTIPERTLFGHVFRERPGNPDGDIRISGGSKWQAERALGALQELSKSTGTIRVFESWDDEAGGQRVTIFRGGETVSEECKEAELVPVNLAALVADLKQALDVPLATDGAWQNVERAGRALVSALEGA